jgi:hypothetical protein
MTASATIYNQSRVISSNVNSAFRIDLWSVMITGLSTISLVLGTTIACMANGYPKHQAAIETVAGIFLLGGLGLMGYALECVVGHP